MRSIIQFTAVMAVITSGMASNYSYAAERSTTTPPAVSNPSDTAKTTAAPVAGKNSFTEGEARARLEKNGYSQVTGLMQDEKSVWHAKATKGGQPVNVSLDYQGNVTAQ